MPLIRINAVGEELELHGSPAPAVDSLRRAIARTSGPVIVMVHGFAFRPNRGIDCPHTHIFSMQDGACWKAKSWPRSLGFGNGRADEGLAIAFGWDSKGMIWDVYRRATQPARALARMIRTIRKTQPQREVHAICHSLGSRVVLQCMKHLQHGDIRRIISLNAAEFSEAVQQALSTDAGKGAELIAVTSRENLSYDLMLENLVKPDCKGDRAVGRMPLFGARQTVLRLDRPDTQKLLSRLGFPMGGQKRWMCHWSTYLRPGTMRFYAQLMRRPHALPIKLLSVPQSAKKPWFNGAEIIRN